MYFNKIIDLSKKFKLVIWQVFIKSPIFGQKSEFCPCVENAENEKSRVLHTKKAMKKVIIQCHVLN